MILLKVVMTMIVKIEIGVVSNFSVKDFTKCESLTRSGEHVKEERSPCEFLDCYYVSTLMSTREGLLLV